MRRKGTMTRMDITLKYGFPEWDIKLIEEKYGLEPVGFDGSRMLYDLEEAEEVFGGIAELKKGNRNVVFRLPKICSSRDLADILHIKRTEALKYLKRFPFAVVQLGHCKCLKMTDEILMEVLR